MKRALRRLGEPNVSFSLSPAEPTRDDALAAELVARGTQSFAYATHQKELAAAFVFYGSAPKEEAELAKITAPVYGFYGESDARITSGVVATTEAMKKAGNTFEPVTYTGAGHGFFRSGEALDASEAQPKSPRRRVDSLEGTAREMNPPLRVVRRARCVESGQAKRARDRRFNGAASSTPDRNHRREKGARRSASPDEVCAVLLLNDDDATHRWVAHTRS